ncbi:hypothetical protein CDL15_Pgr004587 [Punica granatum]|uniref:Uncharacterized protein n=1 Tax=Punica granatum TaxID=22663 RepID=A0A218WR34_PUNGR|nr:hypothetical protein CDL15_Pgr004587 [Punica granatum]
MLMKATEIELEVEVVLVALVGEAESTPDAEPVLEGELGLKVELVLEAEPQHMVPYTARYGRDRVASNSSSLLVDKSPMRSSN